MTTLVLNDTVESQLERIMHRHRSVIFRCHQKGHDPMNCGFCAIVESETIRKVFRTVGVSIKSNGSNKKG